MDPKTPIFDFTDHFDTIIAVGDKQLPIKVKRFTQAELAAFEKKWQAFIEPRGVVELSDVEKAELDRQQIEFCDASIREAITIDEGLIRDRGEWVVDGAGLIGVFHARKEILGACMAQILIKNQLQELVVKNSSSPQDSGTGSAASSQARGGGRPELIVGSAEKSRPAGSDSAMDEPSQPKPENAGTESPALALSGATVQ